MTRHFLNLENGDTITVNLCDTYEYRKGRLERIAMGCIKKWTFGGNEGFEESNGIDKHNEITSELHEIWQKKNKDYGNSFKELREEYPESILIRIGDKYNRLKTLMKQKAEVEEESIEDTLKDLANYCIMELMERQVSKYIKKPTQTDIEEFWEGK